MKLDLLKKSLEVRKAELPADSPIALQLKEELANAQTFSPSSVHYTSLQPFRERSNGNKIMTSSSTFNRCAAVTGTLEVRLMGCQDLLEDVPGRPRKEADGNSSPIDLRFLKKGSQVEDPRKATVLKTKLVKTLWHCSNLIIPQLLKLIGNLVRNRLGIKGLYAIE